MVVTTLAVFGAAVAAVVASRIVVFAVGFVVGGVIVLEEAGMVCSLGSVD